MLPKTIFKQWSFQQIALKEPLWAHHKWEHKDDNIRTLQELDCLFYNKSCDLEKLCPKKLNQAIVLESEILLHCDYGQKELRVYFPFTMSFIQPLNT